MARFCWIHQAVMRLAFAGQSRSVCSISSGSVDQSVMTGNGASGWNLSQ